MDMIFGTVNAAFEISHVTVEGILYPIHGSIIGRDSEDRIININKPVS